MLSVAFSVSALLVVLWMLLMAGGITDLALLVYGAAEARRWRRVAIPDAEKIEMLKSPMVPAVSVLAVPPDASPASLARIQRLLKLHSGNATVVVLLDGASDFDLALWKDEFHLEPSSRTGGGHLKTRRVNGVYSSVDPIALIVVDKEAGGESDCLNAGVNFSEAPVIATVDLEAQISDEALLLLIEPMIADPDRTNAVCADAPFEGAPGLAGHLCGLEIQRNWLKRCALSRWGAVVPAPGAIRLFNRDAVIRAGGFTCGAGEMLVRLQQRSGAARPRSRVCYMPISVSRLNAPRNLDEARALLARDRSESRSALRRHKGLFPGLRNLGWAAIRELLRKLYLDPFAETAVLVVAAAASVTGFVEPALAGLFLATALALKILVSMTGVLLAESAAPSSAGPGDLLQTFFATVPENLGYRQWRNLWAVRNCFIAGRRSF